MKKVPSPPTIGADPEVFMTNPEHKIMPAVGFLKGTKNKPFRPGGYPEYGLQEDNVMLEFNIPPATRGMEFANNIQRGLSLLKKALPAGHGYRVQASHEFHKAELRSTQAQTIGCAADCDAYKGGEIRRNPPPLTNWRSCGGHIHLGGSFNCPDFVAALFCDFQFGVRGGWLALDPAGGPRTMWYGMPGVFRSKPYGIEYRSPSNMWLKPPNIGSKDSWYMLGTEGINLAKWMTDTNAASIRSVFKRIDWGLVRKYLTLPPDPPKPRIDPNMPPEEYLAKKVAAKQNWLRGKSKGSERQEIWNELSSQYQAAGSPF